MKVFVWLGLFASALAPSPPRGDWPMAAGDQQNTRFSRLHQITAANVSRLKLAWSFETGQTRGHEAAPLVVGDTMYLVTPFPNVLSALDLRNKGARKWEFHPHPAPASQGVACCDTVNRGAVHSNGKIYFNTLDLQTIAVDAQTGKEIWRTSLGSINKGESMTMAPFAVKGKIIVGNSGGEFGARGWLAALNENSGAIVWRAYSTGPDRECLIGPNFKPYYADHRGKDLGVKSWPPEAWKIGGGTAWGWISYDPEADLLYYGTSNPSPWNADQRMGDNKWTNTLFARRPDTGEAIWAYQIGPHDHFDYDSVNESIVLDLRIGGSLRKVIVHPGRNGRVYVIDRLTGEVLSAETFTFVNTTLGVDLKTGRPIDNDKKKTRSGQTIRDICPSAPGAKDWEPSAWSPRTGLLYIPHANLCMEWFGRKANYIAGTPYIGATTKYYAGPGGHAGEFTAWDPVKGRPAWKIRERFPVYSGALATAGDVVFYGTMDRRFRAIDAKTGNPLWQFETVSGIVGQPITFLGPDGKQYIAILAGVGGWPGSIVSMGLDSRDGTGANGFVNAMADLPKHTPRGGTLYVFSLP